jgi:pimeloyl-ACP methyl ester carboxylesterase
MMPRRRSLTPDRSGDEDTNIVRLSSGVIEYRLVEGSKGLIVVFHGGHMRAGLPLGEDELLRAGYTVLTLSRPGYGRTPLTAHPSPAHFAEQTVELCSYLGFGCAHAVIGVSAGGPTAVAMAAQQPARVHSLVLESARSSLPYPDGVTRLVAMVVFFPRVEAATWTLTRALMTQLPGAGLTAMMGSLSTLPGAAAVGDLTLKERHELIRLFSRMRSGRGFANDLHQPVDPALERAVTQPTLIVASDLDGQVGPRHVHQLHDSITHATVFDSPSLSHLVGFGGGGPATTQRTLDFLESI